MKITALTENTSKTCLRAEHGLSLFIEIQHRKLLFDTGQSSLFAENADALGIDLSQTDLAVLSHGHYDHGGGLKHFLEINKKAPVYINRRAFEPHYNGTEKYIGLDRELLDSGRIIFTDDEYRIEDGLTLFTCNNRKKLTDLGSFGLNKVDNGNIVPDDFLHEQYLLIEDGGKRVLISGCSHKGIVNIVHWFTPDVLVGGFHLSKLPTGEQLKKYAEALAEYRTVYYTCHCTGAEQYGFMKSFIPKLHYLSTGETITL